LAKRVKQQQQATWRCFWGAVRRLLADTDFYVFGGLVLMAVGLAFIYRPLALVVPGALLFGLGVWLSIPARPRGD